MDQHRLIYASKQVLKYLMYMVSTLTESGPPYSYRTRGYLSSFPGTWIPLTHEKDIPPPPPPPPSQALVTIGNYKKHPLFWAFSANLPEQCQILETCRLVLTQDKGECRPNSINYKYINSINIFTDITNICIDLIFVLCSDMKNDKWQPFWNGRLIPIIILI